jgi:hypothetical protein
VLVTAAVVDVTTGVVLVCCSVLVVAAGVVVEAGSVLVDEATVEVVIGSVVVVAALLVVAADVVVSETSNASSLVTHPTTNDLRRVPSPSSVRLHFILVIGSFWFFGARAPLFQAVLHAAHDLRLTHVHTFLCPTHISFHDPSAFDASPSRRTRSSPSFILSCVTLACCANAAAYFASLTTSPPTTDHFASRLSFVVCECRRTALHTSRLPSPHVRFSASLASDQHFSAVCTHSVRPSRPSVARASITRCSHDDTTFDNAPTPQPTLQDSTRLA